MKVNGYLVTTTDLNTMTTAKSGTIPNDLYCRTTDYISTNYMVIIGNGLIASCIKEKLLNDFDLANKNLCSFILM